MLIALELGRRMTDITLNKDACDSFFFVSLTFDLKARHFYPRTFAAYGSPGLTLTWNLHAETYVLHSHDRRTKNSLKGSLEHNSIPRKSKVAI